MTERIQRKLKPVRARQRWRCALAAGALGLLIGSCMMIVLVLGRIFGANPPTAMVIWVPIASALLGLLVGMAWKRPWAHAATAVDSHYKLKDRASTALVFLEEPKATVLHRLQVADAIEHLERVDARKVAPLVMPRSLPYALGALCVAVLLLVLIPGGGPVEAKPVAPLPELLAEAENLEQTMIEDLEELFQQQPDEAIEELVEKLKGLVEEMKEPGVDGREALAKLSEMQAAIAEKLAQYNLEAVDAKLQDLAEALAPAAAMQAASAAIQEGQYGKAADELEKMDPSKISRKEAKTVAGKLKKVAEGMKDASQGELSEATGELCEGLESEDESQCKDGACKLAKLCEKQGLRKGIGKCLGSQLANLSACKSRCRSNKNGGLSNSKSDSPTNNWGRGTAGDPLGKKPTTLDGARDRDNITGTQGEGPSEREISHSPEGSQDAARSYRETYQEYRKMSEAVLESEPLPLGHRRTIRRYFELIRPQNDDGEVLQ